MSELDTLRTEHLEQARLLGISGERECALLAKIERKNSALRVALDALEVLLNEWTPAMEAQQKGIAAVTALKEALK